MYRIPVYFMPGLAASAAIFERINLPKEVFETVLLEWELPLDNESLKAYAQRISKKIIHENPVLIGVSFGGILVQEMAEFLNVKKIIIISSVKTNLEFPLAFIVAKTTKAYKLLPTNLASNIENLAQFSPGNAVKKRLDLYKKFFSIRDKAYLDWAIEKIILWDRIKIKKNIVHIHGDSDDVFPIKNIKKCLVVKGGTHIMILNKYEWFNDNLPKIILDSAANLS